MRGRCVGDVWEMRGRWVGDVWEMRGRCVGDAWEMCGRCVGDVWEMRGRCVGDAWEMRGTLDALPLLTSPSSLTFITPSLCRLHASAHTFVKAKKLEPISGKPRNSSPVWPGSSDGTYGACGDETCDTEKVANDTSWR